MLDVPLHVQALALDLLQLLHEVDLQHLVLVRNRRGLGVVRHQAAVHAVHVEAQVLHGVLEFLDFLSLALELALDADFLLLEDHLAVLLVVHDAPQAVGLRGDSQELRLLRDPVLLHVRALLCELGDLRPHALQLGLLRPGHVGVVAGLGLQLRALLVVLAVEAVHVELLLLNLVVPLSDLLLVLLDEALALGEVRGQRLVPVLEHLVVRLGVEAVHRDPGDLVVQILRVHLLLQDLFPDLLDALLAVVGDALGGGLLALFLIDLAQEVGDVAGYLLDVPLVDVHGVVVHVDRRLQFCGLLNVPLHGLLQQGVVVHELLPVLLDLGHLGAEVLHLLVVPTHQGAELLVPLLLALDRLVQAADLVLNRQLRLLLVEERLLHVLQRVVSAGLANHGGPPLHHQLLLLELDGFHLLGGLSQSDHGSVGLLLLRD
mmetsp:Transcript_58448/g.153905  ORF Transcript_58448/g.153905 Transcript_58448/m.153905 type:complete len:431 (-) Transcript_58448:674-1966(-)